MISITVNGTDYLRTTMRALALWLSLMAAQAMAQPCGSGSECFGDDGGTVILGQRVKVSRGSAYYMDGGTVVVVPNAQSTTLSILGNKSGGQTDPDIILGSSNTRTGSAPILQIRNGMSGPVVFQVGPGGPDGGPSTIGGCSFSGGIATCPVVDAGFVAGGTVAAGSALSVGAGGNITKIVPCPRIDWDFASIIPRPGFMQYTDKASCPGVLPGDPGFVGVTSATPQDGGSAWEDNVTFFCISKGVDQAQVVMLTASGDGGTMNPPDAGYLCTFMSNR